MKTKNIVKKAKNLASVIAVGAALSLTGCDNEIHSEDVNKAGTFGGYKTTVSKVGDNPKFTRIQGERYFVVGKDFDDGDSTTVDYYEIRMAVPEGHPLRAYANRDSLDRATKNILETGYDL